jgi:hypothetical protein
MSFRCPGGGAAENGEQPCAVRCVLGCRDAGFEGQAGATGLRALRYPQRDGEGGGDQVVGGLDRVEAIQADLTRPLPISAPADAAFSVATFHWIHDHDWLPLYHVAPSRAFGASGASLLLAVPALRATGRTR